MFENQKLKDHLLTSSSIVSHSAIIAEWNMNIAENIYMVGNYRYRPNDSSDAVYKNIAQSFSNVDEGRFYTDATDADVIVDGGFQSTVIANADGTTSISDSPQVFKSTKEKEKLLYSLDDCFGRFRPRSGINKLRYFENKYSHYSNPNMALRPRYYMADRNDTFKYWTSYRTEEGIERGIANKEINSQYYIDDTAPFVVYESSVPSNRIVVKMQTNVGTATGQVYYNSGSSFSDPFTGFENQTTPIRWKIQYLQDNSWVDAITFNENSLRLDGSQIIGPDGYVEVNYGLIIPEIYQTNFNFVKQFSSDLLLPDITTQALGDAYLIRANSDDLGIFYINNGGTTYETFPAKYDWYLEDSQPDSVPRFVTDLTSPDFFIDQDGSTRYREFKYLDGLRVVVETMNVFDSTFDLIELSPRLAVDLSDKTESVGLRKSASDLGITGLPVGQLLASVGNISLFDYDKAFFDQNNTSIVSNFLSQNIQFKIFEVVYIDNEKIFVPVKTMYSEGFPEVINKDRMVTLPLRDLFFYFESLIAPEVFAQNVSFSYAVSLLLDSIGFTNYIFYRADNEDEPIIPFFFVEPDLSVAEVLQDLAISTQTAMFFDEYNNFVTMSKQYIMPDTEQRPTDVVLRGSRDFDKVGVVKNETTNNELANIEAIAFQNNEIFNDGVINFTSRYIQRSYNSVRNYFDLDRDKTWTYKPSLLWEVSSTEKTKSVNEEVEDQSGYALSAVPLNSDLTDDVPVVEGGVLINNTIDLGDGVRWIARYNGYFYANGEIIKYDAVQYSIPGLTDEEKIQSGADGDSVWVTSIQDYQKYFSKIPFGGKMYPTGLVRIYSEPNYEIIEGTARLKSGDVAKHGRGQFGTQVVYHNAGINQEWLSKDNLKGCVMESSYLFSRATDLELERPTSAGPGIQLQDVSGISPGFKVEMIEGIGILSEETLVESINTEENVIYVSPEPVFNLLPEYTEPETNELKPTIIRVYDSPLTVRSTSSANKAAGIDSQAILSTDRSGTIANIYAKEYTEEIPRNPSYSGNLQASALVMSGNAFSSAEDPLNFISYVYKPLSDRYRHFGTRLRIIGRFENNAERGQSPSGVGTYYTVTDTDTDQSSSIGGASGGIGVMVNPNTNNGYFFEIAALTESNVSDYDNVDNIYFYKVSRRADVAGAPVVENGDPAIPVKLWGAQTDILVDSGAFTGQSRIAGEKFSTVYDLAVEYEDIAEQSLRRFYLYINNNLVGIVDDSDPLEEYNNLALFTRGSSKVMFENVYALGHNYAKEKTFSLDTPVNSVFSSDSISANTALQKYAMSGLVQSTYLSNILPSEGPDHKLYFEEFGTIMREAAYFNIKYDKAYPALSAKIAPSYGNIKGYTTSGFLSTPYGAEFLIFNATDSAISLDSTTGNYLRILGVTFTQESEERLTVDEYYSKIGDLSRPILSGSNLVYSPIKTQQDYQDIKFSRMTHGLKSFTISSPYIQSKDAADDLMSWLTNKIMKPRKSVGVSIFGLPTLQLGDIVQIDYVDNNYIGEIAESDKRFVVYHIEYERSPEGPKSTCYLSEVT